MARAYDSERAGYELREDKDTVALSVAKLCESLSIRALLGGGSVFLANRMITPTVSPFLSLIVDPAEAVRLLRELRTAGWHDQVRPQPGVLPRMNTVLSHPASTARLRIFTVIPGFFADPADVFESLWSRRVPVKIRGESVPGFDRVSTAIFATHDRLDGRRPRSETQFAFFANQFRALLSDDERADLGILVRQVGGVEEMRPLLDALGVESGPLVLPSQAYTRMRLATEDAGLQVCWTLAFLELPRQRRWPLVRAYLADPATGHPHFGRVTQIPGTLRAILGARRRWAKAIA